MPSVRGNGADRLDSTPAIQWIDWQKRATSFDAIAAYGWTFSFLVDDSGSSSLSGMVATPAYFRVTGLQPIMGRAFAQDARVAGEVTLLEPRRSRTTKATS